MIKLALEEMEEKKKKVEEENLKLKEAIANYKVSFKDMKNNMLQNEKIRKIQQQQLISLKGNMRVFCRVKPISQEESMIDEEPTVVFPQKIIGETTNTKIQHQNLELNINKLGMKSTLYNFDQVYLPE